MGLWSSFKNGISSAGNWVKRGAKSIGSGIARGAKAVGNYVYDHREGIGNIIGAGLDLAAASGNKYLTPIGVIGKGAAAIAGNLYKDNKFLKGINRSTTTIEDANEISKHHKAEKLAKAKAVIKKAEEEEKQNLFNQSNQGYSLNTKASGGTKESRAFNPYRSFR